MSTRAIMKFERLLGLYSWDDDRIGHGGFEAPNGRRWNEPERRGYIHSDPYELSEPEKTQPTRKPYNKHYHRKTKKK